MIDLSGKHIMVVGGSRGIGASAAKFAARAGANVSVNYLSNEAAANSVVIEIESMGQKAIKVQADASVDGALEKAVETAENALGLLYGMVVSAGIFEGAAIDRMTAEFWDRTITANLRSTFLAVKAGAKHMRAAGKGGSIVIYTSTAGQRGSDIFSAYATSKGAQILFMKSMAKELAPDQIRVNCIAPAWTETDMAKASLDELGRADVAKTFALGRIGLPDDVAGPTVFLLSDLAGFVTGVTLTVDGGMDMRG
ncbi:MAG: SDR family oxidoreductase [Chthonomonadales bacterium]